MEYFEIYEKETLLFSIQTFISFRIVSYNAQ